MLTRDFMELAGISAVVGSAQESGLLGALLEGSSEAGALAQRLGLEPAATAKVLDVLVVLGVAEKGSLGFTASDSFRAFSTMLPNGLESTTRLWGQLPAYLNKGIRGGRMDGDLGDRQAAYSAVVSGLGRMFGPAARRLAELLPRPTGPILDVGAGSGIWSLEQARRAPGVRVTSLDLPAVLPNFLQFAEDMGLADRVDTLPGSFHEVVPPAATYARIITANVLHLETEEGAAALLKRLRPALAPGGELIVVDALAEGNLDRDLSRTLYDLHLTMRTANGANHPRGAIESWCRAAGFAPTELIALDTPPNAMAALVCRGI
jgi:precorrin-6B methylase 2